MNRNTKNWLKAIGSALTFLSSLLVFVVILSLLLAWNKILGLIILWVGLLIFLTYEIKTIAYPSNKKE